MVSKISITTMHIWLIDASYSGTHAHDVQTSYQLNCVSGEIGMAEHLYVLFAQIARVEDALFDVQFEQHWLHSQTARQAQGMAPL